MCIAQLPAIDLLFSVTGTAVISEDFEQMTTYEKPKKGKKKMVGF